MECMREKSNDLQGRNISLNREWTFRREKISDYPDGKIVSKVVNLPHDYMVENDVTERAPGKQAMGYYTAGVGGYVKELYIPKEWEEDRLFLRFDGSMMNTELFVDHHMVGKRAYGYVPFEMEITKALTYGEKNRIAINVNPCTQPNSRWYTGAGLFRGIELVHTSQVRIANDGIFFYTDEIEYEEDKTFGVPVRSYHSVELKVDNATAEDVLLQTHVILREEKTRKIVADTNGMFCVKANQAGTGYFKLIVENPKLWDVASPVLYVAEATIKRAGYVGGYPRSAEKLTFLDQDRVVTGIRTISVDAVRGFRVNGKAVKLQGGCVHHDNGIIGAVSVYDAEYRKCAKLKSLGFNAVRTSHNPPSAAFLEACDRIGMYVIDEAFDAWRMAKQPGDYNLFFDDNWEEDMAYFMERDRNHPAIIFWSTGNEIPERGGLSDGYHTAAKLAAFMKSMDRTRPVSNALCGFWGEPENKPQMEREKMMGILPSEKKLEGADWTTEELTFAYGTEAFVNMLDVVSLNYFDGIYEKSKVTYPERVILGTESYPSDIDLIWEKVMANSHVPGDFTWTCWDHIGEAGLGKSIFVEEGDSRIPSAPWGIGTVGSEYPWRLSYAADFDITGLVKPQGYFRSIVWGSKETVVFTQNPKEYDKIELTGRWAWPIIFPEWNYQGFEGKMTRVVVYSAAEQVELYLNGKKVGQKTAGKENRFTAFFEVPYENGTLEAISITAGEEVSRKKLVTAGKVAGIRLYNDSMKAVNDEKSMATDGQKLQFIQVELVDEEGSVVPDSESLLTAKVTGEAILAGFGTGIPKTDENYSKGEFTAFHGHTMAVVRSDFGSGKAKLIVSMGKFTGEYEFEVGEK